jgi:hypothetical protein
MTAQQLDIANRSAGSIFGPFCPFREVLTCLTLVASSALSEYKRGIRLATWGAGLSTEDCVCVRGTTVEVVASGISGAGQQDEIGVLARKC